MPRRQTAARAVLLGAALLAFVTAGAPPLTAAADGDDPGPPRTLRYLTLNLFHGGVLSGLTGDDQDLEDRLDMVVEELRALDADIIGLQEASTGPRRGSVAERLAARLGFHAVYAPALFRFFGNEWLNAWIGGFMRLTEGPAIVSRFPIVAWQRHDLPRCGGLTDVRVLLHATVRTPWGLVDAASTHTSAGACQAPRIAALVHARRGPRPTILMGDFNAEEGSPEIARLTRDAGFVDVFRAANPTAPGFTVWQPVHQPRPRASRRVDYVFLVPGTDVSGRVVSSRVVLDRPGRLPDGRPLWPSDHHGVLAEIEVLSSYAGPR